MAGLAWIAAPILDDHFSGQGNVPLVKALLLLLTAGLIWQFVLVVILVRGSGSPCPARKASSSS